MSYLKLFANCKIVLGAKNALICDLQKNESELIPIEIGKVFQSLSSKITVGEVLINYSETERHIINDYIRYIIDKGYAFFCDDDEYDLFPDIVYDYDVPYQITNAIIERNTGNAKYIASITDGLEALSCQHISIVFYEQLSQNDLLTVLSHFRNRKLKSFDVVSEWTSEINADFLHTIPNDVPLSHLSFFAVPQDLSSVSFDNLNFNIVLSHEKVRNFSHCGKVNIQYFSTNLPKVSEAMNFNSCLNKKISVDIDGNIRNCPSMPKAFGNIKSTTLQAAFQSADFKEYWAVTKDDIAICKDCEFRYICTDCRAYTERTATDISGLDVSKPLKCGYNPYTAEWEEWSTNPLKQKAIQYYGM